MAQTIEDDRAWFERNPDRQTHIREARRGECEKEFRTLGPHQVSRRRMLIWKVPKGMPFPGRLLPVPFLAFADETIDDTDEHGLKLLEDIMQGAAQRYGVEDNRKPIILQ